MKRWTLTLAVLTNVVNITLAQNRVVKMMPENGAIDVNIDTHLMLTMEEEASIGQQGFVSVYDKQTGKLVDRLDMSIAAGPTQGQPKNPAAQYTPVPYQYKSQHITNRNTKAGTPSGVNAWDTSRYQLDIIGGFSDGFHFYPIIVHGKQLTIYLHHNMLDYGHEYYVTIDKEVITGFQGIKGKRGWTFRTKEQAPDANLRVLTVSADGTGDFSTVQGALDFIPDSIASARDGYRVFVKNGDYEELVYSRNKRFVIIEGESRDGVLIHYPNNEVFNPHPADIKTNEVKGTFPSRRAAFAVDNCSDLVMRNLTVKTDCKGQAEGMLVNGERNYFENLHIIGDGDALQANGSCYWHNCRIDGGGDTVLGRGPSFFNHCTLTSYGAFMWIRNTEESHGNVFVDCHFKGLSDYAELGRLPDNKGKNYPYAECVLLNCTLENVPAFGWGRIDESANTATILEFNSHDAAGNPIDTSERNPLMRQLDPIHDAQLIGNYSNSQWVLGWPTMKGRHAGPTGCFDTPLDSIRLSDPAILADKKTGLYYMTGTGGMMWRSRDLKLWDGPYRVTTFDKDSWMGNRPMIWAAEIHQTGDGFYYYFATFTNQAVKIDTVRGNVIERRASQVLRADNPMGPYRAFGDATYLPADRPTLDGTFWRDVDGKPYMVFCGEWLQNWNGTMEKIELKPDFSGTIGQPKVLFRASDSSWSRERQDNGNITWNKVTDGPWLFRTATGRLGMLWTSWVYDVYTQGVAYSESGTLDGPWVHEPQPITPPNYGHSMLFQRFDGQWMMSVHSHQKDSRGRTVRIPHLFEVDLSSDQLVVKNNHY